jgi:glycosyltransferase involved in cell wall biosynthesis
MTTRGRKQRHVITPEYPPQVGGVSDYVHQVAAKLAEAGEEVHIWCPVSSGKAPESRGVIVHQSLGTFAPSDLLRAGQQLDGFPAPRRILIQWVPHGYGYRSMNLGFCWWAWNRSRRSGDEVEIMVHEPFLAFGEGNWRQNMAALVHRLMTILLVGAAERVWVSIPEWASRWRPYTLGRRIRFDWLPIPSNVATIQDSESERGVRRRHAPEDALLIGHFGTYGPPVASLLEPILLGLGRSPGNRKIILMGSGGESFCEELLRRNSELAVCIAATGVLQQEEISSHIAACDLLIQPYPGGVSTRRTTFMAALAHGRPVVTTTGPSTEPFWANSEAAALTTTGDASAFVKLVNELCADAGRRFRMGQAARKLYEDLFAISHTIAALRNTDAREHVTCAS